MDIADKIYNAVPGLCDWIGNMSFNGLCVLMLVVFTFCIFLYVCICYKKTEREPYDAEWMDYKKWAEDKA